MKGEKIISYRKTAIAVGALFILSSLTGALSVYIYGDIFRSADFLTAFSVAKIELF
jgi:hypothetical protein